MTPPGVERRRLEGLPDRFEVRGQVGEGATKSVYLAWDRTLAREVAVAVVDLAGLDTQDTERVLREARASARLSERVHVVTLFDVIEAPEAFFFVSRFMVGGDLAAELERSGSQGLALERVLDVGVQLSEALQAAHEGGITHRDLKPANILLDEHGDVYIADFGLARVAGQRSLTQRGEIVGTPHYISPEQLGDGPVDHRADLYSLGCVLYELITGRPPFSALHLSELFAHHLHASPLPPGRLRPGLPPELDRLVVELLAKRPADRPPAAERVAVTLRVLEGDGASTPERESVEPATGFLVGRGAELAQLSTAIDRARAGRGAVALVAGEAGIGKTRLVEEACCRAEAQSGLVLIGHNYAGDVAPAYWPWSEILRQLRRQQETAPVVEDYASRSAELALLVPGERREQTVSTGVEVPASGRGRFQLFDVLSRLLQDASVKRPLVLVLEDLHWADEASLLLLEFLAAQVRRSSILIIGTYRDSELNREHPMAKIVRGLLRHPSTERIELTGLSQQDASKLVVGLAGTIRPALVQEIVARSEGSPFFITELALHLRNAGGVRRSGVPRTVREVIWQRIEHLRPELIDTLRAASVIGREFLLTVLEEVTRLEPATLESLLHEAVAASVVEVVPAGSPTYRFTHALIRETLYEELSSDHRARLHERVGTIFARAAHGDVGFAELAYHFRQGLPHTSAERAVEFSRRAGREAFRRYAYEEAARHFGNALQLVEREPAPDRALVCELLLSLAESEYRAGPTLRTLRAFERAAGLARELGDPAALARALIGHVGVDAVSGSEVDLARAPLEEALAATTPGSATRAKLLGRLASLPPRGKEDTRVALGRAEEALQIAESLGDGEAESFALLGRHDALPSPEQLEDRVQCARKLVGVARENRLPEFELVGRYRLFVDLLQRGDVNGATGQIHQLDALSEQVDQKLHRWRVARLRAMLALLEGRLGDAEPLAEAALGAGTDFSAAEAQRTYGLQIFTLRWLQGRLDEIVPMLEPLVEARPEDYGTRSLLALSYVETGQWEEAGQQLERLSFEDFRDLPSSAERPVALVCLAETCAQLEDATRCAQLALRLEPFISSNVLVGSTSFFGAGAHYRALLAAACGDPQTAALHFETSLAMNRRMQARPWLVRTASEYGRMLLDRSREADRARAADLLADARQGAEKLGMRRVAQRVGELGPT